MWKQTIFCLSFILIQSFKDIQFSSKHGVSCHLLSSLVHFQTPPLQTMSAPCLQPCACRCARLHVSKPLSLSSITISYNCSPCFSIPYLQCSSQILHSCSCSPCQPTWASFSCPSNPCQTTSFSVSCACIWLRTSLVSLHVSATHSFSKDWKPAPSVLKHLYSLNKAH